MNKNKFLYPKSRYYGEPKLENLIFNSKLQEFVIRVSYICNLVTNNKILPIKAYEQINLLWTELENSISHLKIDD